MTTHRTMRIALLAGLQAAAAACACATTTDVRRSIVDGRVLEVAPLDSVQGDCVVFTGGLRGGWQEGMQAVVRRGDLQVAAITLIATSDHVSAALIESLAPAVRIGAGDTVSVKVQQLSN